MESSHFPYVWAYVPRFHLVLNTQILAMQEKNDLAEFLPDGCAGLAIFRSYDRLLYLRFS